MMNGWFPIPLRRPPSVVCSGNQPSPKATWFPSTLPDISQWPVPETNPVPRPIGFHLPSQTSLSGLLRKPTRSQGHLVSIYPPRHLSVACSGNQPGPKATWFPSTLPDISQWPALETKCAGRAEEGQPDASAQTPSTLTYDFW